MSHSDGTSYFERLYAATADPWDYATSAYEQDKYAATCDALEGRVFVRGLEVGCSFGVLSRRLAAHCRGLLAVDLVETVLERARRESAALTHLCFERMAIPASWPKGSFDLIVFSEVLYYLSGPDLLATAARTRATLEGEGMVVLVNWLGDTASPHTGDEAADAFIQAVQPVLRCHRQSRTSRYRLDILAS
jgi:predicted TPR repeat methyltransferase